MSAVRATALRAGGACVRCRKGKTKCVYENGRAPCKNCAKGMHECYLPSESMSHGGHGVSPARVAQRSRESLPTERASNSTAHGHHADRHGQSHSTAVTSRNTAPANEKYVLRLSCCLSVRPSVRPSVCLSVKLSGYLSPCIQLCLLVLHQVLLVPICGLDMSPSPFLLSSLASSVFTFRPSESTTQVDPTQPNPTDSAPRAFR